MPETEINLLAGPPGVGKTTLALQIGTDIQDGIAVWGRRTFPTGMVIVSLDRSSNAHQRMIGNMSIPSSRFAFFSARNIETSIEIIIRTCANQFPQHKLLFIDGFATLCDGPSDYLRSSQFLRIAGTHCEQYGRTILGSVHSAKTKEGEHYTNPRQRILGSVAWAGFADLIVTMDPAKPDDPEDLVRIVHVLPRLSREFTLKYQRQSDRLVPWEDPVEADLLSLLDFWLGAQAFEREIPKREFVSYGKDTCSIAERTVEKWLTGKIESGLLERPKKGTYRRVQIQ